MQTITRKREGFALVAAIGAIVVIGALVAGGFFAATQEYRVGRNSVMQQRAFTVAERALSQSAATILDPMNKTTLKSSALNAPWTTLSYTGSGERAIVSAVRTNPTTWVLTSTAEAGSGSMLASRTTSHVLRMSIMSMAVEGALTVKGFVDISGNAKISGIDADPTTYGWNSCDSDNSGKSAIATDDSTDVTYNKEGSLVADSGVAKIKESAEAGLDATYDSFGDVSFDELAASADVVIPTWVSIKPTPLYAPDGTCYTYDKVTKKTVTQNWGDPFHNSPLQPCDQYYPIIYAASDLELNANSMGQGVLLIDGNLKLNGSFDFVGVVIVRGQFTNNGDANITGAIMVKGEATNTVTGTANINYSSCALEQATESTAPITLGKERGWGEMF